MSRNAILITVGVLSLALPGAAATIQVTTTNPEVAADGECSLIEAILNANADAPVNADCPEGSGADTIELASSADYVLDQVFSTFNGPNGLPVVSSVLTIEGHGSTIRRADDAPAFRLMPVDSSGVLTLVSVTLSHGDASSFVGGALINLGGNVTLSRVTMTENSAYNGGGLYNASGMVTLIDSEVSFNTGTAGVGGLVNTAIFGGAVMAIERSTVHANQATDSDGGGISSYSPAAHPATLEVIESVITDNTASDSGGGIRAESSFVTIEASTISGNHAGHFCAGLFLEGGSGDIDRSTFSANVVDNTIDYGTGGGLCVADNTTTITNSTISGNQVLGPSTGQHFSGRGGGLAAIGGAHGNTPTVDTIVIVEDSTICDNIAETLGGGISVYRYAGLQEVGVELRNTVISDNYEAAGAVLGNCIEDIPAIIASFDYNLADDTTCNLFETRDLVAESVMLSPLADHGGPTRTHRPMKGSPAIDSGDDVRCSSTDQHGNIRPWDGDGDGQAHCDRGAVELGAPFFFDGFESGDTIGWSNTVP